MAFLVQRQIGNEVIMSLMTENELVDYINMDDVHDELYQIYDGTSVFGEIKKLHYKGWQPNCLIEVVDDDGNIIVSRYGEDH